MPGVDLDKLGLIESNKFYINVKLEADLQEQISKPKRYGQSGVIDIWYQHVNWIL